MIDAVSPRAGTTNTALTAITTNAADRSRARTVKALPYTDHHSVHDAIAETRPLGSDEIAAARAQVEANAPHIRGSIK